MPFACSTPSAIRPVIAVAAVPLSGSFNEMSFKYAKRAFYSSRASVSAQLPMLVKTKVICYPLTSDLDACVEILLMP